MGVQKTVVRNEGKLPGHFSESIFFSSFLPFFFFLSCWFYCCWVFVGFVVVVVVVVCLFVLFCFLYFLCFVFLSFGWDSLELVDLFVFVLFRFDL